MNQAQTVYLDLEVSFAPFLAFDRENGLYLEAELQVYGDDPFFLDRMNFEETVEATIAPAQDRGDYQFVYCVAHELRRIAESLSETAQRMEDGNNAITDLYDMTPGDLDD